MKSLLAPDTSSSVSERYDEQKRGDTFLFMIIAAIVICLTPVLMLIGMYIGFSYMIGGIVVLAILAFVARWPVIAFFLVAVSALVVEQDPSSLSGSFSYTLYVFYWPTSFAGLIERPIGFFILFAFIVLICHRFVTRQKLMLGGELFLPFLLFMLCVVFGVVHGITGGGDFKTIVVEVRPFWYLFLSYVLAYNLVSRKEHVRLFFWFVILGAGVKSLQGVYIYYIVLHASLLGHHEIMAHEESFFFVALILLVILFSLHYSYRPQLITALCILPFTVIAMIANQRRADYVALLVGLAVVWVLVFVVKPHARKSLVATLLIFAILVGGYTAAFYNSGGGFSEPARAVVSIFHPDPTEAASNLYRDIEDYDLKYTVLKNPLGLGFGKPFLQPILLPDILTLDQYYLYVPHNTIYWVWMRLGPIGYLAFWYLIGAIIVRGCLIARRLRDRYLQLVAIYIVGVTFMEVIVAFADYQLYFYRNVIYLGLLAGILLKLPAFDKKEDAPAHETIDANGQLALSNGGRERS